MKVLIDIGHPGHVHLFKPFAKEMQKNGHQILFTCRQKEFEIELLEASGFDYISFGKHHKSKIKKISGLFQFVSKMYRVAKKFKPDIFLSHGSLYSAFTSFFIRKPHIALEDTGNMEQVYLYLPFTDVVLTSDAFHKELGKKQLRYPSFHELAYLHPKYFSPNEKIFNLLGINKEQPFAIVRFISWDATHDLRQAGLSFEGKREIINKLKKKYKVFISSESNNILKEFEQDKLHIPPEKIHDALYFANLYVGEGATMASESAMLGTPAIYINSMEAGTINEQQKYGLLYHYKSSKKLLADFDNILADISHNKEKYSKLRNKLLMEKIDLTAFLVWFVENYPDSLIKIKNNKNYPDRFCS